MMGSFEGPGGRLAAFFTFLCFKRNENENEYEKDGWNPM